MSSQLKNVQLPFTEDALCKVNIRKTDGRQQVIRKVRLCYQLREIKHIRTTDIAFGPPEKCNVTLLLQCVKDEKKSTTASSSGERKIVRE